MLCWYNSVVVLVDADADVLAAVSVAVFVLVFSAVSSVVAVVSNFLPEPVSGYLSRRDRPCVVKDLASRGFSVKEMA